MWQEYGDLAYLIWNFQPLEESSRHSFESSVEHWMEDHAWMDEDTPEPTRKLMASTVATATETVAETAGSAFAMTLAATGNVLKNTAQVARQGIKTGVKAAGRQKMGPQVGAPTGLDVADAANGFFEGLVDVFPYESNPKRCQTNSTQGYTAFDHLFLNYDKYDLGTSTSQLDAITDISDIFRFPYGISYSCYYGYTDIMQEPPEYDDWDSLTPEQKV